MPKRVTRELVRNDGLRLHRSFLSSARRQQPACGAFCVLQGARRSPEKLGYAGHNIHSVTSGEKMGDEGEYAVPEDFVVGKRIND